MFWCCTWTIAINRAMLVLCRFMLALVQLYKQGISPLIPNSCRYIPTCSTFAQQAFEMHGVGRGCILTALRIARCNPLGGSGYDPVPKEWPWSFL